MSLRQYHQHHSLRDEEDLFNSALSDDFGSNISYGKIASSNNNRPWQTRRDEREPYELLDDVPPANLTQSTAAASTAATAAIAASRTNIFPELLDAPSSRVHNRKPSQSEKGCVFPDLLRDNDRLLGVKVESNRVNKILTEVSPSDSPKKENTQTQWRARYSVEQLYPSDNNDVIMGDEDSSNTNEEYEIGDEDDYYSHMQYSEPIAVKPTKNIPSRYPIDDDGFWSDEDKPLKWEKKVGWYDPMVVSPTGSDEIDTYQPMHLHSGGTNKIMYDGTDTSSSHYSDDKSTGTFDRLYDEEYSGIHSDQSNGTRKRESGTKTQALYLSPVKEKADLLSAEASAEHSPDSVMDTPVTAESSPESFLGDLTYGSNQEDASDTDEMVDDTNKNLFPAVGSPDVSDELIGVLSEETDEGVELSIGVTCVESSNSTVEVRGGMKLDDSYKSSKMQSPEFNTTGSNSSGPESDDDNAIQDLARVMHQQQREYRKQQRFERRSKQSYLVPESNQKLSRLEQWQLKQQQRQQASPGYLPPKYQQQSPTTVSTRKNDPRKLEPEDVDARDPDGVRYYGKEGEDNLFPDMEWDANGRVIQRPRVVAAPSNPFSTAETDEYYNMANVSMISSAAERIRHSARPNEPEPIATSRGASSRDHTNRHVRNHHQVPDELSLLDSYDHNSCETSLASKSHLMHDDVSVISVDTELRRLAQHLPIKMNLQRQQRFHPYSVKPKDSMESMMLELDEEDERYHPNTTYNVIKRNDSMEQDMMVIDFDRGVEPARHEMGDFRIDDHGVNVIDYYSEKSQSSASLVSPPDVHRHQYSFVEAIEEEEEEHFDPSKSYSDESEATNDPAIFPTKAVYKMNLGHASSKEGCESSDLIERACELLSRGRNEDALKTLNEALEHSQATMDSVKELMDDHYYQKERCLRPPTSKQLLEQEEYEEKLDSDFREAAATMADIINNIGVIHELNGDCSRAMSSFRDALDIYRRMCHRYENKGDADVDRTVTNIMHMGIALRSREKREDLHSEAEELAEMIDASDDHYERAELRVERLHVLMSVLDVENESLGQSEWNNYAYEYYFLPSSNICSFIEDHPTVGFTLLKKGKLHLEMKHTDLAIKDIREAIAILKNGLGNIHPAVGRSLLYLADIYNYQGLNDHIEDRNTALKLYQEALEALCDSDLGLAHNSMGIIYAAKGQNDLAMESFYNALSGYGVRAKGDDVVKGQTHPDVAFVWLNVGDIHMENREWKLALRSYLKAHSALRGMNEDQKSVLHKIGPKRMARNVLSRSKGRHEDNEALLAFVLQNIARAESMLHKYGKSIEVLEEALRIHKAIDMRCKGVRQHNGWSKDVARILENLGEVQMASGNVTSAFDCYVESLKRLRSNDDVNGNRIEVALVLGAIGQVHLKKQEYAEATVVLKECMRTLETLGVPSNNRRYKEVRSTLVDAELGLMQNTSSTLADQRRQLSDVKYLDKALACDEIADAYRNKDDLTAAIWFYSEALSLRREKVMRVSGSMKDSEMVDIGKTISTIAELRHRRREFEASKILFDEAKHFYKMVGLSEEHPFFRDLKDKIEVFRRS
jgi:tetratricopeptide (TPR) repeat protein